MEKSNNPCPGYSAAEEGLMVLESQIYEAIKRNPGDREPLRILARIQQIRAEQAQLRLDMTSYNENYLPDGEQPIRYEELTN